MEDNNNNATYKDDFAGDRRYLKGFLANINLIFMILLIDFLQMKPKLSILFHAYTAML